MPHQIGADSESSTMAKLGSLCGRSIASDYEMPSCVPASIIELKCNPSRSSVSAART